MEYARNSNLGESSNKSLKTYLRKELKLKNKNIKMHAIKAIEFTDKIKNFVYKFLNFFNKVI